MHSVRGNVCLSVYLSIYLSIYSCYSYFGVNAIIEELLEVIFLCGPCHIRGVSLDL
jgi:hypothetical protein